MDRTAAAPADVLYSPDPVKLGKLQSTQPWLRDVKYFTKVKVSAVAAMKMTSHASAGVEKGLAAKNAMPIEIMGLMTGTIDTEEEGVLIINDVFPLPVEGTETRVMSDSDEVIGYMTRLSDAIETRGTHISGWYHSHPFDVGVHSNCFLSAVDVGTQLSWQNAEDRNGNPWLAIVVDPLRSVAKGRPEIGAFRCYPAHYTPDKGLAPDGVVWEDERARNARWGESCVSYYQMEVEYFMSSLSDSLLDILSRGFLWTRVLASTPMLEKENRDRVSKQLTSVAGKLDRSRRTISSSAGAGMDKPGGAAHGELKDAHQMSCDLATEACRGETTQTLKHVLFNALAMRAVGGCGCGHSGSASASGVAGDKPGK